MPGGIWLRLTFEPASGFRSRGFRTHGRAFSRLKQVRNVIWGHGLTLHWSGGPHGQEIEAPKDTQCWAEASSPASASMDKVMGKQPRNTARSPLWPDTGLEHHCISGLFSCDFDHLHPASSLLVGLHVPSVSRCLAGFYLVFERHFAQRKRL